MMLMSPGQYEELRKVSYLMHAPMTKIVRLAVMKYLEKAAKNPGREVNPWI